MSADELGREFPWRGEDEYQASGHLVNGWAVNDRSEVTVPGGAGGTRANGPVRVGPVAPVAVRPGPLKVLRALTATPRLGRAVKLPMFPQDLAARSYPPRVVPEAAQQLLSLTEFLARSLGQRIDETLEHTARVVELAGRMAQALGFSADQRDALIWGARLHDIGKLAVPPEVLNKQGTLDPEEWRAMRGHVEAGKAIAESLDCLPWVSMCVLTQHHERWNGSGYPLGLAGDGICLEARVFAFCDVYDALTHARAYKPAWTRQRALREICRLTGSVFDPALLGVFVQVVSELPEQF